MKTNDVTELGFFSPNRVPKNRKKDVLTQTKYFGAPADNYGSGDIGKRKKPG